MTRVDHLLASMRRPLPPVPPGAPLCQSCGQAAAEVGELEPIVCRPCLYRLTSIAAEPRRFEAEVISAMWDAHADVLDYGPVVVDEHVVIAWPYMRLCQHKEAGWIWPDSWPTDDQLQAEGAA